MLDPHRHLDNRALAERKTAWEQEQRTVTYGQQSAHLKEERTANAYLGRTHFSRCQATLRRLDRAVAAFFRRVKIGETPGDPRFKGQDRFDPVELPSYGDGCTFEGSRVYFQHMGLVTVKLHRPVEGPLKTLSCKREADGWHMVVACELPDAEVTPSALPTTGMDLGLKVFLVTADGMFIEPPRFYRKAQAGLRCAQR